MGEGPLTESNTKRRLSWKLRAPHDANVQGLVVSGFASLPCATALFLRCDWETPLGEGAQAKRAAPNEPVAVAPAIHGSNESRPRKGEWLEALGAVAPITVADGQDPRAAAIAFTWTGLQKLGLPSDALDSFSPAFKEGMLQEDRLRRLGDTDTDGQWTASVITGGPLWSGNTPIRSGSGDRDDLRAGGVFVAEPEERQYSSEKTVHALLMLYDTTEASVQAWSLEVERLLKANGVSVVHRLSLSLRLDENRVAREHFGFADGISQPIPYSAEAQDAAGDNVVLIGGQPAERDPWHGVPLGEILFGHTDAHHEKAPGPLVRDDDAARAAGLEAHGAPEGYLNLGLDGSYMVVRELQQDVAAFWKSIHDGATRIKASDPKAEHATPAWLAERIVGRNLDGHLLCPSGLLAADADNYPRNTFGFLQTDPHGVGCPPGSHVRRANPRDSLAKDEASAQTLLDAANSHRILRRGRKYGDTVSDPAVSDGKDRGLLFICLNTDIARQFEFVQQTWILNPNFATLYDETDPLVGPKGRFTIREQPLRRIVDVETFVRMAGGEYFFLPSLPALRYLASL